MEEGNGESQDDIFPYSCGGFGSCFPSGICLFPLLVFLLGPLSESPPIEPNCSFKRPNFSAAGQNRKGIVCGILLSPSKLF